MKKSLLFALIALMFLGVQRSYAQSTFIRVGGGFSYYQGEDDSYEKTSKRITPSAQFTIGTWFNDVWGIQGVFGYTKAHGSSIGESPYCINETFSDEGQILHRERFNVFTFQPEVVYNISNGMCGASESRVFNFLVHAGLSYGHSWVNKESANALGLVGGATCTWRISPVFGFFADARYTMFNKGFDKVTYRNNIDIMPTITAGISFNIGR